jgi:hypothetical protein
VKVDISVPEGADAAEAAAGLDTGGPDRLWLRETDHDVFLQSLRALQATSRLARRPAPGRHGPQPRAAARHGSHPGTR